MSTRPALPFDRVADRYDDTRGGTDRGVRLAADITPLLAPGRILEIGVGTGLVANELAEDGWCVHGVDLAAAMLARARDRLGPRVVRGDARALPIASSAVDNVVFVAALHVVGDVPGAVAEAARVLRPGGRLVAVHGMPSREPATDDIATLLEGLHVLRDRRPDSAAAVDAAAAAAGLTQVSAGRGGPVRFTETPADLADNVEGRLWSYLWDVDDATWQAVVAPVVAAIRALPDPDRPRAFQLSSRVVAYAR